MNALRAPSGTQSVLRAVGILKLFHSADVLRLGDVREHTGLNRTTAFRLLTALESEGLVEREGDAYRLGPEIALLGRRALGGDLGEVAGAEMARLCETLHETVTLEVLAGDRAVIVAERIGEHLLGTSPSLGTSWPAHATATGKVLLAALDRPSRARVLGARLARLTPKTLRSRAVLEKECARIRSGGYALNLEELEPGYVAVAVPVLDASGVTTASLSVGGPVQRWTCALLVEAAALLERSSAAITRRLGGHP